MYNIRREFGAENKRQMNNVTLISETNIYSNTEQQEMTRLLRTLIFMLLDKKGGRNEMRAEEWEQSKAFYIPFSRLRVMKYQ